MRWVLFILATLFISIFASLFFKSNEGFIYIDTGVKIIEMRLYLFVILAIWSFVIFYIVISFVKAILGTRESFSLWFGGKKRSKIRKNMMQGLISLAEGNFKAAEKKLSANASKSEEPVINYLGAAIAAYYNGDNSTSEKYIRQASVIKKKSELAVGLIDAILCLKRGKDEEAIAKLVYLNDKKPNHKPVLKLLYRCYEKVGDWSSIASLLPTLEKNEIISKEKSLEYDFLANKALLDIAAVSGEKLLKNSWSAISKPSRLNPEIILHYVDLLIDCGQPAEAEKILRENIPKQWDSTLIDAYGRLKISATEKMLSTLESWIKKEPHNYNLNLAAARLSEKNQIWGKARGYYESSVDISATKEALTELGMLLEQMQEPDTALDCYRMAATTD